MNDGLPSHSEYRNVTYPSAHSNSHWKDIYSQTLDTTNVRIHNIVGIKRKNKK